MFLVFSYLLTVFSWTVRMMCNLDSESVAIERIREYDNLPQVDIAIKIINIIMDRMSFLFFIGVIILVILRKLLGRHRQSSPLHWIGQTGERFSSSSSSSSPLLSHVTASDPIMILLMHWCTTSQILVDNVTASHAPHIPPALCKLHLSISGGEKVINSIHQHFLNEII